MCVCVRVCVVFFLSGNKVEFYLFVSGTWRSLYKLPGTNADCREVCMIKCRLPNKMAAIAAF